MHHSGKCSRISSKTLTVYLDEDRKREKVPLPIKGNGLVLLFDSTGRRKKRNFSKLLLPFVDSKRLFRNSTPDVSFVKVEHQKQTDIHQKGLSVCPLDGAIQTKKILHMG